MGEYLSICLLRVPFALLYVREKFLEAGNVNLLAAEHDAALLLQAGQEVHLAILLQPLGGHVPRQLGILLRKHLPSAWPGRGWGDTGQRPDREPSAPPFRLEGAWLTRVCPFSVQILGPQRPFRGKVSWIHSSTHALQPVHMSTHLSIHPLIQKKKKKNYSVPGAGETRMETGSLPSSSSGSGGAGPTCHGAFRVAGRGRGRQSGLKSCSTTDS